MRFLKAFCVLYALWVILSAHLDPYHLTLGALGSALVAFLAGDLMFLNNTGGWLATVVRFILYLPWLLWEIVRASLHVMYLVFHPRMRELIDPHIVTFTTSLTSDVAQTTLGNSITLTPGTLTVLTRGQVFHVHAISRQAAAGLPGEMERRIGRVFREGEDAGSVPGPSAGSES